LCLSFDKTPSFLVGVYITTKCDKNQVILVTIHSHIKQMYFIDLIVFLDNTFTLVIKYYALGFRGLPICTFRREIYSFFSFNILSYPKLLYLAHFLLKLVF